MRVSGGRCYPVMPGAGPASTPGGVDVAERRGWRPFGRHDDEDRPSLSERRPNLPAVCCNKCGEVGDRRHNCGERRMKAFAWINGLWFQCVYTMRGSVTHIITVHRVKDKEMQRWLGTSERR